MTIFNITETEPTLLIRDFATFTRYLKAHQIVLTRANEFISGRDLYELNKEMTNPIPDATPRTDQTLYPLLHLFYHLALAGKLFQKVPEKGRMILRPTGRIQLYLELKPIEKCFFLLETLWVDADWEKLQAGYFVRSSLDSVHKVLDYLIGQQPGKKVQLKKRDSHIARMLLDWEYFLLYFSFFGFWEVTRDKDLAEQHHPKRLFRAESITSSTFGVTIAQILNQTRNLFYWNLPFRREMGEWKAVPGSPLPNDSLIF